MRAHCSCGRLHGLLHDAAVLVLVLGWCGRAHLHPAEVVHLYQAQALAVRVEAQVHPVLGQVQDQIVAQQILQDACTVSDSLPGELQLAVRKTHIEAASVASVPLQALGMRSVAHEARVDMWSHKCISMTLIQRDIPLRHT